METGIAEGTFTLACLADGSTSLYLSDGFGTVGGGVSVGLRCPIFSGLRCPVFYGRFRLWDLSVSIDLFLLRCGFTRLCEQTSFAFVFQPEALALAIQGRGVVQEPVKDGGGDDLVGEDLAPVHETLVGG